MAKCDNCGAQTTRVRSAWNYETGERLPDACPNCRPELFEKFTAPSDKKIWMGFEANPNQYEKRYDAEGVYYIRKPEYRAEQEAQLQQPATDEREAEQRAIEKKRRERRTEPMTPSEHLQAIAKARQIAECLEMTGQTDVN